MRQTILSLILVLLLLASGYLWFRFFRDGSAPAAGVASEAVDERIAQYRHIKNLKPDTALFADPLFNSLKSATPLSQGSPTSAGGRTIYGRTNPFSPF